MVAGDFKGERRDCGENLISQWFVGSVAGLLIRENVGRLLKYFCRFVSRVWVGGIGNRMSGGPGG